MDMAGEASGAPCAATPKFDTPTRITLIPAKGVAAPRFKNTVAIGVIPATTGTPQVPAEGPGAIANWAAPPN